MRALSAKRTVAAVMVLLLLLNPSTFGQSGAADRSDIDARYTWDLSHIYPDWATWEADLAQLDTRATEFLALKGTLAQGPEHIYRAMKLSDDLQAIAYKVYKYPAMAMALDNANNEYQVRLQQVQGLFLKFSVAMAWFSPEMLSIPRNTMEKWLDEYEDLAPYQFGIRDMYRQQEHVLDEDKERLLSLFSPVGGVPYSIYNSLTTSDMTYNDVTLSSGEDITVTEGTLNKILLSNRNQADRASAFEALYDAYNSNRNTYAAIYSGLIQTEWAQAQARNYGSCLEASLHGNSIPAEVVETVITTARNGLEPLKRYHRLRKGRLNLDDYHFYDGEVSLVDFEKEVPFEEACRWVYESVAPLGEEYQKIVKEAFENRWVDVFETAGKAKGAYTDEVYGVHPYILLNYNNTMHAALILAHETAHCVHTYLAQKHQPMATWSYSLFVAEVSSAINEILFADYLLNELDDPLARIYILTQTIDDFERTFFTQSMIADFELQAHRMVEQRQPLTADILSGLWSELWREQVGDVIEFDSLLALGWCRKPHIYIQPFYVYQYASSHAAANKIGTELRSADKKVREGAIARYLDLLRSGGSDYPMNQLALVGVDMSDPTTYSLVVEELDRLVTQLEEELARL